MPPRNPRLSEIADQAKIEPKPAKLNNDAVREKTEITGQVKDAKASDLTNQPKREPKTRSGNAR
jgi:hypothetical protein